MNSASRLNLTARVLSISLVVIPSASAQFRVGEMAVGDYQPYTELVFGFIADELNSYFNLAAPIEMVAGECQQVNAFFLEPKDRRPATIVLCKELLDTIVSDLRARGTDESTIDVAFNAQLFFVTLHEVGHALIRELELPLLGREEDAADQFASLMFSGDPILSLISTAFWSNMYGKSAQYGSAIYADTHALNEQRNYNVLCWTYGADPLTRSYVVQEYGLPVERAAICQSEFARLASSWLELLRPHLTPNGVEVFGSSEYRDTSGVWRFVESMTDDSSANRCSASGSIVIVQIGDDVSGSFEQAGSCVFGGLPYDNSDTVAIDSGTVTAEGVYLEIGDCTYTGKFTDESMMTMEGALSCDLPLEDGSTLPFSGKWMAVR